MTMTEELEGFSNAFGVFCSENCFLLDSKVAST